MCVNGFQHLVHVLLQQIKTLNWANTSIKRFLKSLTSLYTDYCYLMDSHIPCLVIVLADFQPSQVEGGWEGEGGKRLIISEVDIYPLPRTNHLHLQNSKCDLLECHVITHIVWSKNSRFLSCHKVTLPFPTRDHIYFKTSMHFSTHTRNAVSSWTVTF